MDDERSRCTFQGRLFDKGIADFFLHSRRYRLEMNQPHYVHTRIGASIASITQGMVKASSNMNNAISAEMY